MKHRQFGNYSSQTALLLALFGLVLAFAVPILNEFSDKNKVTEAYHLASESKLRLDEFYKMSARFPSTEIEMNKVTTSMYQHPEFVTAIVVEQVDEGFDIVVKVLLKEDIFDNDSDDLQFVYMAGTKSHGLGLEWSCGASGLDNDLLPRTCNI